MKRIFSTLCLALLSLTALADEGMWLPSLISSRIDDMRCLLYTSPSPRDRG